MVMQVPCCSGLAQLALRAAAAAAREVPMRYLVVGVQGEILGEGPLQAPARRVVALPVRP